MADYGERVMQAIKEGEETLHSVSRYELIEELGEGGMGTVFLADQISEHDVRKPVAVKMLKDTHDEAAIQRLIEESRLLAHLGQGTIVELLALESKELTLPGRRSVRTGKVSPPKKSKLYFMVQEYVNGPSLEKVLREHGQNRLLMCPAMVGFVLNKAVIALAEAHDLTDANGAPLDLVHRDISPSNILFMARAGITKLADFGVARAFRDFEGGENAKIVGKPRYMAPEQLDGNATQASDIWALGVIGYEALTGYPPYKVTGATTAARVANLKAQFAHPLRAPDEILRPVPNEHFETPKLSTIIMQCLNQDPVDRPTAQELNSLLEGSYLYRKGLGPTNKTLAAYLMLTEAAIGEGEIIPPEDFDTSEEAMTMRATLKVEHPVDVFRKRATRAYAKDFLLALKAKEANPCLLPGDNGQTWSPTGA